MRRTLLLLLVPMTLVVAVSLPADADHKPTHKHKAKSASQPTVVRGSYQLQLRPDPCGHTSVSVGQWGCYAVTNGSVGRVPDSRDIRALRFSGPGTFRVTLTPERTLQPALHEWDLDLASGNGAWQRARQRDGSYETSYATTQGPATLRLLALNNSGWPNATVTWSFTYRFA